MNDIDDDRGELEFMQLDLSRYFSKPCSGGAHVPRQLKTVLQDRHLVRRVGALFRVPGSARDGDQNDPNGNVW
jgi:hypothetical protein